MKKMVCYYVGDMSVKDIDVSICTHIVYTFLGVDASGNLTFLWRSKEQAINLINQLNGLKTKRADLKVLAAVGGANESLVSAWSSLASNSDARNNFANNVLQFLREHNLNGIDIDWEYPNKDGAEGPHPDQKNFILLLQSLKNKLGSAFSVSAAIGACSWRTRVSYPNVPELFSAVDFVNLMTYDLHGEWEDKTGLHTALCSSSADPSETNVTAAVKLLINAGAPRDKIIVGMATYGKAFFLTTSNNGVGAPSRRNGGAGTKKYFEIEQNVKSGSWTKRWDDGQKTPYAFKENYWIGYDDQRSIIEKSNYIRSENLGGGMFWALDNDDYNNVCGGGRFPLISAAYKTIVG